MAGNSLILSGVSSSPDIELVPAAPLAAGLFGTGSEYRILLDYDYGDPQAITTQVASLLLDGTRVVGRRSGNRQLTIPVQVRGADRDDLASKVAHLAQIVDLPTFLLSWTPFTTGAAKTLVFDCFRAQVNVHWSMEEEGFFTQQVDLVFEALPFGRSQAPVALSLTNTSGTRWDKFQPTGVVGTAKAPIDLAITLGTGAGPLAVIHCPPATADNALQYVLTLGGGTVTVTAAYQGTYDLLTVVNVAGTAGQRSYSLLVEQLIDGVVAGSQTLTQTTDITAGLGQAYLRFGPSTLPLVQYQLGGGSILQYRFTITDTTGTGTATTFRDVILIDTLGQTVIGAPDRTLILPAPTPEQSVGPILGRPTLYGVNTYSALAGLIGSGGPFSVEPFGGPRPSGALGPAPVWVYAVGAGISPSRNATATYTPRWLTERLT